MARRFLKRLLRPIARRPVQAVRRRAPKFLWNFGNRHGYSVIAHGPGSPIPRIPEANDPIWSRRSSLIGVQFDLTSQLGFITEYLATYIQEFDRDVRGRGFNIWNNLYQAGDAEVLYALLRHLRPKQVLEIGSGNSTVVAGAAMAANRRDGSAGDLVAIDPNPTVALDTQPTRRKEGPATGWVVEIPGRETPIDGLTRVERVDCRELPFERFEALQAGDVLFLDTTHIVKLNSEVNWLVLEVHPMADVDHNLAIWSSEWDWSTQGDEWSEWWGDSRAMWHGALLPRIHPFLPAKTILEIAPGYGRWTHFLKDTCDRLVIVDLTEGCIEHCRMRFADSTNIEYHVNDGRSLEMVADGSIDFVFSFDSLVHAEADVMQAYVEQLARKLSPDGVGFLHHSNIGSYRALTQLARRAPVSRLDALIKRGALINITAWRAESMTADLFVQQCEASGLVCIGQEKINWEHGRFLIDSLSTFTRPGSRWERSIQVVRNPFFTNEAARMKRLYAGSSF